MEDINYIAAVKTPPVWKVMNSMGRENDVVVSPKLATYKTPGMHALRPRIWKVVHVTWKLSTYHSISKLGYCTYIPSKSVVLILEKANINRSCISGDFETACVKTHCYLGKEALAYFGENILTFYYRYSLR